MVTMLGMVLNAITTTSAAVIVYLTYIAKLKFDADMLALKHRVAALEEKQEKP